MKISQHGRNHWGIIVNKYDHPLKDLIHQQGDTYDTFAEKVGISRDSILNIIKRRYAKPYDYTIERIAEGLKMPYAEVRKMVDG